MTAHQVREQLLPQTLELRIVEDGAEVPFLLINNSIIPIEGYRRSCDCLGTIQNKGDRIEGKLIAKYKEPSKEFYQADGQFTQKYDTNAGPKYFNPKTNQFVENPTILEGPLNLHEFTQNITLEFKDGETKEIINEFGEIKVNPKKIVISIPVRMLVKQKM